MQIFEIGNSNPGDDFCFYLLYLSFQERGCSIFCLFFSFFFLPPLFLLIFYLLLFLFLLFFLGQREGVIFISGDVHFGEITRYDCATSYPLYDITSSGLTQAVEKAVPWPFRALLRLLAWLTPTTMRVMGPNCRHKSCTYGMPVNLCNFFFIRKNIRSSNFSFLGCIFFRET